MEIRNCDLPELAAEVEAMKEDAAKEAMDRDDRIFTYNKQVIGMVLSDMLERGRG